MKKLYFSLFFIFILFSGMFATPLRIIGMGSLDLIIEDESNRINLFDYGRNVAGLYSDERGSFLEGYISFYNRKLIDTNGEVDFEMTFWGVSQPSQRMLCPYSTVLYGFLYTSLSNIIPSGISVTHRSEGGWAFSGSGAYNSSKVSTKVYSPGSDGEGRLRSGFPIGGILISKQHQWFSIGILGGYNKQVIKYGNSHETLEAAKIISVGFAVFPSPLFDVGIGMEYTIPEYTQEDKNFNFRIRREGSALSGNAQVIGKIPGLLSMGLKMVYGNATYDATYYEEWIEDSVSYQMEDINVSELDFGSRLLFASFFVPMKAGINFDYRRKHIDGHEVFIGDDTFTLTESVINFGVGISYSLPLFTPGIQYNLYDKSLTMSWYGNSTTNPHYWDIRFGGEAKISIVTLRGGYIIGKDNPNRGSNNDTKSNIRYITTGAGIQIPLQPWKVEVAYLNKERKPEDYPEGYMDKEIENSVYAAFRLKF